MRFLILFLITLTFVVDAKVAKTDHAEISIIGNNNIISEPGIVDLGYKFVFTPAWMKAWKINKVANPLKEIFKNWLSWLKQFLIILNEIYKKITSINIEVIEPYSSEITAIT